MPAPGADLLLPAHLRSRLARPFGPVVQTDGLAEAIAGRPVAAVGDVVATTCLGLGIEPRLIVCDLRTQRGEEDEDYARILGAWGDVQVHVENPAGRVTPSAWTAVAGAVASGRRTCIVVAGEEDLLGLPVLVEAPDGWVMLYGMPGAGVVVATVDAALRGEAQTIVSEMVR